MASLPYEFGWKALKDNDVGPDNHTGAAREPKRSESHSWSKLVCASQCDRGVPTKKFNKENYQVPHMAPSTLQQLQET